MCHQERLCIRMTGQRPPGNQSHHHKARDWEPRSTARLLASLILLFLTRVPFPDKISSFSAQVSPRTIHFQLVDKSPVLGPGRGPLSYNKYTVYCDTPYLPYLQSTSCKMPRWVKHKLELRLPGEISVTSDMQLTPPLWQKVKKN